MIMQDMRFNQEWFKSCIGKKFQKYQCDPFLYTHSVTQNVGVFIGSKVYRLQNKLEPVDYFGEKEDIAVFRFLEADKTDIVSALQGITQVKTFVNETIRKIRIVNEEQRLSQNGELLYQVFLTRGIIFELDSREISFEKDQLPFSEEIYIQRGHQLLDFFSDPENFKSDWDEDVKPECIRQVIEIE